MAKIVGLCFQGLAPSPSLLGEAESIHPNSPAQYRGPVNTHG